MVQRCSGVIVEKTRLGFAAVALGATGILWWQLWSNGPVTVRGSGGMLTIAVTGDSLILKPMRLKSDRGVEGVARSRERKYRSDKP